MPVTHQSTLPHVFFGGDSAFGPKNIIWAVAHGHAAAISIDKHCQQSDVHQRPPPHVTLISQKMGIHEWSYDSAITLDLRKKVPLREQKIALADVKAEVELGFDRLVGYEEARRCLNCDVQTVFSTPLCIECDACVDICPAGLHHLHGKRRGSRPPHPAERTGWKPDAGSSTSRVR